MVAYKHSEAYALMTYLSDDGKTGELIWNSRDGVTPFIVHSVDGVEMTHVDWDKDVYAPHFRPPPGMRVFVDMTEEMALEAARERVEEWWDAPDYPMSARWETKEDAAKALAKDYVADGGQPTIIVTPPRPVAQKASKF